MRTGSASRRGSSTGRRFTLRVTLPRGDVTVRVTTVARNGQRSSAHVHDVFGLPPGSRPRVVAARRDRGLERKLTPIVRGLPGHGRLLRPEPHGRIRRGVEREGSLPGGLDGQARDRRDRPCRASGNPAAGLAHRRPPPRDDHPVRRRGGELAPRLARGLDELGRVSRQRPDAGHRLDRHAHVRRLRDADAFVGHPASRRRGAGLRGGQVHDRAGHDLAVAGALARLGRHRAAALVAARPDSRRCPVSPLAHRPRTRPAEARRDGPSATARSTCSTRRAGSRRHATTRGSSSGREASSSQAS